ncbi:MAG: PilZ domain-containing protein [Desulfobacterales bacterium]|jgi:c-di-GMP-binding flagellar brake protein YcgR|nr:PilZ domain-containing protein [Desulfobacterales bacterium]MDH3827275.1 PilZ domain-containing protein [Desulfobacterales bacterium]MDH4009651.1 PilZ domain-containing protein [Desulfobacterales bacterium]
MTLKSFSGKERRAYVRLERSLPVRFKIFTNQMSKTYTATTKNISQGGLCLEIYQDARQLIENLATADSKVGIDLDTLIPRPHTAASATPAWINSRVDWSRKPTAKNPAMLLGLEFEGVTDEARKRIHDYIVEEFVKRYEEPD